MTRQLEDSLRALRTDYIDLYQYHSLSDSEFDDQELRDLLENQKKAGKIRHIGNSIAGATDGLHQGSPVSALREGDINHPDAVAYLCGPQPMIDAATKRLIELGMKSQNIFAEQFVASN